MARPDELAQLKRSRLAWLKSGDRARDLIDKVLANFDKSIEGGALNTEGQLEIVSGLKDIAAAANNAVLTAIRAEKAYEDSSNPDAASSAEEVLAELSGGRG